MLINVQDFMPKGVEICDDTIPIQAAIDRCSALGGGKVCLTEKRTYHISGIQLKSHVELHLGKGTILKGSGDIGRYNLRKGPFERLSNNLSLFTLIHAKSQENIKITGEGIIDGSYEEFSEVDEENLAHRKVEVYPRPTTIYFEDCKQVEIKNIQIRNVPFWTIHLVGCMNTIIEKITIKNDLTMPNTDGIDIDRCKNTWINDCTIITADDAICLKCTEETYVYGDLENVVVSNCLLTSISSAVKFGSSSFGNFKNCLFEHLHISESNRGLAFQIRDTHSVENIVFRKINIQTKRFPDEWWGRGEPIYITICPREQHQKMGSISHVTFEEIDCVSENKLFIYGHEANQIKDIRFKDIHLSFQEPLSFNLGEFDLRPTCLSEIYCEQGEGTSLPLKSMVLVNAENAVKSEGVSMTHRKGMKYV